MARALPQIELTRIESPAFRQPDDLRVTREMLIHALEHPNRDVRSEAARRLSQCLSRGSALPLARWLMQEPETSEPLATLVITGIFKLPESTERSSAIMILSHHPSENVQRLLAMKFCLPGGSRTSAHKD